MEIYEKKDAVLNRLKRIEGQIKGIQRMIEEDKFCGDVLVQITAARSALNKVGGIILENHMKECLKSYIEEHDEDVLDDLIDIMVKYTK